MITTLRARVAVTMQPFVPRLLMMLPVEVSHGDRDWLHEPGLNHADNKPFITRRFNAERILKRIHFHHKRRRRRKLTVEPSSTRTDLLTSHESTTPIPSRRSEGSPPRNHQDFSPTRGPMTIPRGWNLGVGNDRDMEVDVDVADQSKPDMRLLWGNPSGKGRSYQPDLLFQPRRLRWQQCRPANTEC